MKSTGDETFDAFWHLYPRRCAKAEAKKAWTQVLKRNKMSPDELLAKCADALSWQVNQPGWQKDGGQYIPYPASYLRAEQFDDLPFHPPSELPRTDTKAGRTVSSIKDWLSKRQAS